MVPLPVLHAIVVTFSMQEGEEMFTVFPSFPEEIKTEIFLPINPAFLLNKSAVETESIVL